MNDHGILFVLLGAVAVFGMAAAAIIIGAILSQKALRKPDPFFQKGFRPHATNSAPAYDPLSDPANPASPLHATMLGAAAATALPPIVDPPHPHGPAHPHGHCHPHSHHDAHPTHGSHHDHGNFSPDPSPSPSFDPGPSASFDAGPSSSFDSGSTSSSSPSSD